MISRRSFFFTLASPRQEQEGQSACRWPALREVPDADDYLRQSFLDFQDFVKARNAHD